MKCLKITTNEYSNPLFVPQGKLYNWCLESMLTDHPIFDKEMGLSVGSSLTINIEVVEMSQEDYDKLESWEPD